MIGNSIIFFSGDSQSKSLSNSIIHRLISFGFEEDHTFIVRIVRFTLLPGNALILEAKIPLVPLAATKSSINLGLIFKNPTI
jgi:hypothetical protein